MPITDQAYVTLCTNDVYCQGALVLGKSLRNHETSRKLVVMITSQVSAQMRTVLGKVYDEVSEVDLLDSADLVRLSLLKRPELGVTFTKIQCWTLTRYTKCVYMDADTIALCNIDELFDREEFSAAPDSGWPDCFNSGVFVFRPSLDTFGRLLQYAEDHGSFDGGDQGLLNSFFSTWATSDISKHLPFIYNLSICSVYTYIPAFKQFGSEAKVVHFIGTQKPWNCKYDPQTKWMVEEESLGGRQHLLFLLHWWEVYVLHILPLLTDQEELEGGEKLQFGRIELQMKEENPSPDVSAEASSDNPGGSCSPSISSEPPDDSRHHQDLRPPQLSPGPLIEDSVHMPLLSESVSELSIREAEEAQRTAEERRGWEEGRIDYMGKYSFDNIQKKLDRFLQ